MQRDSGFTDDSGAKFLFQQLIKTFDKELAYEMQATVKTRKF